MMRKLSASSRWLFAAAFGILGVLAIGPATSRAADPPALLDQADSKALISRLETAIPELMQEGRVPGLQIALIRDGKTIWHKSIGFKNADTQDPVTDQTIFEAASLTKPLFAYAVMMLAQESVIDLQTPLITYFTTEEIEKFLNHPIDKEGFHREWLEVITPRHVLSHSAGTPHGEREEVFPLFFEPGTQYKYSATGYYWLQMAVVKLTGEPLEKTIQERVLDPLGMTHSCLVWRDSYESVMANGHNMFGQPQEFRKYTKPSAAATLYTTADEYARFVCAVLNGDGLDDETLKEMLTPQMDVDEDLDLTWSLGFGLQEDANGLGFWQWGDYGIFRNYILAYPEKKLGVVYLTNSFNGLGICQEMVGETIGGQALGVMSLNYWQYDSPRAKFFWAVQDRGVEAVYEMLPELYEKYPDDFEPGFIGWIGREFNGSGMSEAGIAMLEFAVKEDPESPAAYTNLARAYLDQGDRKTARLKYEKALELAEAVGDGADEGSEDDADDEDAFDATPIYWALDYIEAFDRPVTVPVDHLQKLAGDYGARHFQFREGALYYLRDGTSRTEYTKLTPMSQDMYAMEGVVYFKMQFEYDDAGQPTKVIGLYDHGYQDDSPRDD